ncbi:swr complex subunit [Dissophora ornata]|nr:swr complex subunit [Dissophora ornata]
MATGNDIREIFQLKPSDQVKRVHKAEKKPGMSSASYGISRELYGLIGNNVSTVAFNNPTYKPKLNVSKKAVNWTWRPFVNPSRDDDLILHHWEKTRTDPNEEYRFYKFNKAINLNEFTPEEYTAHLQDPGWNLEETSYLWDLCRRFDLRWVVIQDRYEWPPQEQDRMALSYYNGNNLAKSTSSSTGGAQDEMEISAEKAIEPSTSNAETADTTTAMDTTSTTTSADTTLAMAMTDGSTLATAPTPSTSSTVTEEAPATNEASSAAPVTSTATSTEIVSYTPAKTRSMEELKNRYYNINRILIKIRMSDSSQAVEKAQLLSSMAYDKNREVERKKNLEILNTRTPEQIEEEEALYLEARRIDQNERKITRERENLLRLLNTRDMYGPGGPASAGLAGQVAGGGGPGTGIIIPSNSITIPSSSPSNNNGINGPLSPSVGKSANGVAAAGGAGSQNAPVKKRKKAPKGSTQAEEAAAAASAASAAASGSQTKGSSSHRRPSNDGSSSNLPQGVQVKKEKLTPGAYLRSQKMTPIVSTKQQRVTATLTQLGLPLKPSMPTATVMTKWDQLTNNIVTLLDLKKQVDKLEADLKVVKMRRGSASGLGLFPASGTAAGSATGGGSSGAGGSGSSLTGSTSDGNFGVKREGTVDETGTPGQVKKKKRKE